jgi:hypothetical protein
MSSDVTAPWEQSGPTTDPESLAPGGEQTPPLHTAVEIKTDFGVVGEEHSFLVVLTAAAGGGGAVCMYGLSRSGKDHIMDSVEACFPDSKIHSVPERGTESSLFRESEEWNRSDIHRHKDLVNLEDIVEDILKHHGDDRSISRTVNMQDAEGNHIPTEMTLRSPGCLVYFLASDNEQVNLDDYPELRNRSLVITTDASQELSEKIQHRQAKDRGLAYERNRTNEEIKAFRHHVDSIPVHDWEIGNNDNSDFYHPYHNEFSKQHPIPSWFVESRMDSDRFWDFIEIMSLWYHKDRMVESIEYHGYEKDRMVCTPADLWYAMRIYGEKLILSALSLGEIDKRIMWFLREQKSAYTASAIAQVLGQAGFNVTPRDVQTSCKSMVNKNYIMEDNMSGTNEYQATPFASDIEPYSPLDWDVLIADAEENVYNRLPDNRADEYVERFCGTVICTHPITGEEVDITEYQDFEHQVQQREEDLKKMVGTSIYENVGEDSETDPNGPEGGEEEDSDGSQSGSIGDGGLGDFL